MPSKTENRGCSNVDGTPVPAAEALEKPKLTAQELQQEIGDSETWDEASEQDDTNSKEDN